ncbi:MAG: type I-E CRISPR-associated protein Cse1/CasA [Burkholderiaceae bacterium]|nr:type I-E CRISPR-associated protein Cse1/CasA [Burkholderiaceae bacterium]
MRALNLLTDPLILVRPAGGAPARLDLPELLARMSAGEALDFPLLRPHQQPAWHAFLVQLAYLALELAGRDAPPIDGADWRSLLRALTADHPNDVSWCLVVDDWLQPAFLQSPCLPGGQADYRRVLDSAQDIDLLITSKHHDEKSGKLPLAGAGEVDALVFALVSLQGFSAFLGAGNYNTMRMNGGFSSRPQFRFVVERGSGPEFRRDLTALLTQAENLREQALDAHGIGTALEHRLLWLTPWGAAPLALASVHPLCLEVCRRVRLRREGDTLQALTAASATARVDAKDRNGVVMDPWLPLVKDSKDGSTKALTAHAGSFGYRSLSPILFDGARCVLPLLARPTPQEQHAGALLAQVLVGGSGRSDGLLRREIPLRGRALRHFAEHRDELAQRAQRFVDMAGTLQGKVLRPALLQFVDGSDEPDWQNNDFAKFVAPWVARFDQQVDEVFYGLLFATLEADLDDSAAESRWLAQLRTVADALVAEACEALPSRDRSRVFARARAERVFVGGLFKHFRHLLPAAPADAPATETANVDLA